MIRAARPSLTRRDLLAAGAALAASQALDRKSVV